MLDIDKVEMKFNSLKDKTTEEMAQFACEVIPQLISQMRETQMDFAKALVGDYGKET